VARGHAQPPAHAGARRAQAGGGRELVTAPLDGTILPGVTRDSVLALARRWGEFDVSERPVTIREVREVRPRRAASLLRSVGIG